MSHIFVSYSKKQRKYARTFANYLIENGFDVWVDDRIDFGEDWWHEIVKAIRKCAAVTVIMTPDSEGSRWVQREVSLAEEWQKPVFPLLLSGENWPLFVRTQYIDVSDGHLPDEDFIERLGEVVPRRETAGENVSPPIEQIPTRHVPRIAPRVAITLIIAIIAALLLGGTALVSSLMNQPTQGSRLSAADSTQTIQAAVSMTRVAQAQTEAITPSVTLLLMPSITPTQRPTDTPFNPGDVAARTRAQRVTLTAKAIASFTNTASSTPTITPSATQTPNTEQTVAAIVAASDTAEAEIIIASMTKTPTVTPTFTATKPPTLTPTLVPPTPTSAATTTPPPTQAITLRATIKIVSHSPLSGAQSMPGTAIRNGTDLAIRQLGKPLRNMGVTVQFVPIDDQANPEVGVANAEQIVTDGTTVAVIGHLNSGVAIPASEIYNQGDLAMVSPANINEKVTDRGLPTVNRVCGRQDRQAVAGAEYAIKNLKVKSVYIFHDKSSYGEGVATLFNDYMKAAGINVLGFEGTEERSNFSEIVDKLEATNPDLIYFGGIYDQAAVFLKQARPRLPRAHFMGSDGMDSSETARLAGSAAVGLIYTVTTAPAEQFPNAKNFVADYKATFKVTSVPYFAAESYAATQIALAGIERAIRGNNGKMPTRKQIAAAIRATRNFPTIIGTITFDANGDPVVATYSVLMVKSADPAKWDSNEIVGIIGVSSPLTQ